MRSSAAADQDTRHGRVCRRGLLARAAIRMHGEIKEITLLTLPLISDAVVAARARDGRGDCSLKAELPSFAARPDATLALPRISRPGDASLADARQNQITACRPTVGSASPRSVWPAKSRNTGGSKSGRSSAISPAPKREPASACSHTAAQAASKAGMPCASSPAQMPASTSPEPAVASQGGPLALIAARPSGDAITVSAP